MRKENKQISFSWRIDQLQKLRRMVHENEESIIEALMNDLGRSRFEAKGLDLIPTCMEIDHTISHLRSWMKPSFTPVPLVMAPATSETRNIPLGVVLIMGPFNYVSDYPFLKLYVYDSIF